MTDTGATVGSTGKKLRSTRIALYVTVTTNVTKHQEGAPAATEQPDTATTTTTAAAASAAAAAIVASASDEDEGSVHVCTQSSNNVDSWTLGVIFFLHNLFTNSAELSPASTEHLNMHSPEP